MFWVFILICLVLLWGVVQHGTMGQGKDAEINYSELYDRCSKTWFWMRRSRERTFAGT